VLSAAELKQRLRKLHASSPARRPLLIFDQFEEFATLFEEAPRGEDIQPAQRAQETILSVLIDLQRDATLPVKLLFSFREDYLAKLSKLIALWPDLSDQSQRLTPPGADALPRIIRGSFEKYPGSFDKELSPTLADELTEALKMRNEGGKINLSEVQIACLQLWKSSDPEALFKSKGVQGLLEDYLSDSINKLAENLRDPAVALLSRMVTPSGTRNIVSEYDLISQVQEDEGLPEERLQEALRALVQETRLVRRERRYESYFYDIVSEFLVPWIRRQKIERLAAFERQKQRKKFLRVAVTGLLVAGVVFAGLLALIYFQRQRAYLEILKTAEVQRAHAAEMEARNAASEAKASENKAQYQLQQADIARKAAEDAKNKAESETAKLDQQVKSLQIENQKSTQAAIAAYDRVNTEAGKTAFSVYQKLGKDLDPLDDVISHLSSYEKDSTIRYARETCVQVKNHVLATRSDLRKIGKQE
jgi:hypothetical protein